MRRAFIWLFVALQCAGVALMVWDRLARPEGGVFFNAAVVAAALAGGTFLYLSLGRAMARTLASRSAGRCRNCGYDLTGNVSGVCPECGTKVDGAGKGRG